MADQEDTLLESMKSEIATEETKPEQEVKTEATEEKPDPAETEDEKDEKGDEDTAEDEGEETGEKDSGEPVEGEQPRKTRPSASETIRALKAERKAAQEKLQQLEQERAAERARIEFEQRRQQEANAEAARKKEEEALALLDPTEKAIYLQTKRANELEYRLNVMHMEMQYNKDRSAFEAKMSTDPLYAKYGDQVEKLFQEGLKRGVTAPREELLNLVLGRELRKEAASKLTKKKEAAGKRIDTVTSKPASARSDVSASKKGQTEEDRLRNVLI